MAVSQADADALLQAIARGVRRVTQDGQTVEYQSTADMLTAYNLLLSTLADQAGLGRSGYSYVRVVPRWGCLKW
jgi:hypothetical protein